MYVNKLGPNSSIRLTIGVGDLVTAFVGPGVGGGVGDVVTGRVVGSGTGGVVGDLVGTGVLG